MKTSLILTAVIVLASFGAVAQSCLVANDNPIFDTDGKTLLGPATGTTFEEELYLVSGGVAGPIPASISPINQGYFCGPASSSVINLPGAQPDRVVQLQIEIWDSSKFASFEVAFATPGADVGTTPVFTYRTGHQGGGVPAVPPPLEFGTPTDGLTLHLVPETTTLDLALIGLAGLLLFARSDEHKDEVSRERSYRKRSLGYLKK